MADYRIYCIDRDGRIGFAQWLEAECDEEAVAEARRLRPDAERCELWQVGRLVAVLDEHSASRDEGSRTPGFAGI